MIPVSRLTLGTAQLGRDYGIANKLGRPELVEAARILKTAVENGITSFDTARSDGDSEKIIGSFLLDRKPEGSQPLVISKLPGMTVLKNAEFENIYKTVKASLVESLDRLKIDKMPIYLVHSAKDIDSYGDKLVKSLTALKEQGVVDILGVSVYHPAEAERIIDIPEFKAIQIPMNLFDHRFLKNNLLKRLKDAGMTVFVRSVYLQGLFFMDPEELSLSLTEAAGYLKKLGAIARDNNMDIDELAIRFVDSLDGISSMVIGAETRTQVLRNVKLAENPPLDLDLQREILKQFSDVPEKVVLPYLWGQ